MAAEMQRIPSTMVYSVRSVNFAVDGIDGNDQLPPDVCTLADFLRWKFHKDEQFYDFKVFDQNVFNAPIYESLNAIPGVPLGEFNVVADGDQIDARCTSPNSGLLSIECRNHERPLTAQPYR